MAVNFSYNLEFDQLVQVPDVEGTMFFKNMGVFAHKNNRHDIIIHHLQRQI